MGATPRTGRRFLPRPGALACLAAAAAAWLCYRVDPLVTEAVLSSALRQSTPLVLGALCGILCERSGVMNIGIEGQMLLAAFLAHAAHAGTGSPAAGVLAGVAAGALAGGMLAFMSVTLRVDQIVGGAVINILALGLTGYFFGTSAATRGKLSAVALGPLADIPLAGAVLFDNPPLTYTAVVLVGAVHIFLFHTPWGLRLRAVGEHPRAADSLGIGVAAVRYAAVTAGGALAGLAGAFLSLEAVGAFERAMTGGRGFVALAVMIFGKWMPFGAWGAALLFGLAGAVQTQLQFARQASVPHQFIAMLPYLFTIGVLAGFVGRSRPPGAVGRPWDKE